jgi:hypothetical protein
MSSYSLATNRKMDCVCRYLNCRHALLVILVHFTSESVLVGSVPGDIDVRALPSGRNERTGGQSGIQKTVLPVNLGWMIHGVQFVLRQ